MDNLIAMKFNLPKDQMEQERQEQLVATKGSYIIKRIRNNKVIFVMKQKQEMDLLEVLDDEDDQVKYIYAV